MKFTYAEGATPIRSEEKEGLIPHHIRTQQQLNEWEEANISKAILKYMPKASKLKLSENFMNTLHKDMFDKTWKWAGKYRTYNTNIGVDWLYLGTELRKLMDDTSFQIDKQVMSIDEIATRFHHRLVFIHAYPNGNGRHSRLMTDLLLRKNGQPPFSWGATNLTNQSDTRALYISALKEADNHNLDPLLNFVRL